MSIFSQKFTTGQVTAAAGVTNAALQSWLRQDRIIGHKTDIQGGGTPGAHRRYSFFNVMEIALAKALLDAGMGSVEQAFKAAASFAHVGHGELPGFRPARDPGVPFDNRDVGCLTLLCVRGDRAKTTRWTPTTDFYANVSHDLGEGFVLVEVDPIFQRVTDILGFDFRDVMADAYPRGNNA